MSKQELKESVSSHLISRSHTSISTADCEVCVHALLLLLCCALQGSTQRGRGDARDRADSASPFSVVHTPRAFVRREAFHRSEKQAEKTENSKAPKGPR